MQFVLLFFRIISKLAFRNSILEEASKDNDNLQQKQVGTVELG